MSLSLLPCPNVTVTPVLGDIQEKAPLPMVVTAAGMLTVCMRVLVNALSPIV